MLPNTVFIGSHKVGDVNSMSYNSKNRKAWSVNALAAKQRQRTSLCDNTIPEDDEITIEITRKLTNEHVVFTLLPGGRCDNYLVSIDGKLFRNPKTKSGCMGISTLCQKIAKALPRVRSEYSY